jgi:hypothetical protein
MTRGTVIGTMQNPQPTPLSLMQEMVADGHGFAAAYVDFQSRLLNAAGAVAAQLSYPTLGVHMCSFASAATCASGPAT